MHTDRDPGTVVWGIAFVVAGIAILLSNLGYLPEIRWEQWWPILLIVIGFLFIFRRWTERPAGWAMPRDPQPPEGPGTAAPTRMRPRARGWMTGIILIGLGVAFLLQERLGGAAFPGVILIALGVAILLR